MTKTTWIVAGLTLSLTTTSGAAVAAEPKDARWWQEYERLHRTVTGATPDAMIAQLESIRTDKKELYAAIKLLLAAGEVDLARGDRSHDLHFPRPFALTLRPAVFNLILRATPVRDQSLCRRACVNYVDWCNERVVAAVLGGGVVPAGPFQSGPPECPDRDECDDTCP